MQSWLERARSRSYSVSDFLQIVRENIIVILFFLILLGVGISVYRDYGVSWDEPTQRDIGKANIEYILSRNFDLLKLKDRFYGPTFEIFLLLIEKMIRPASTREIFFLRHLTTFLTFFAGVISFYILSKTIYRHPTTALLSSTALVLSPRIFDNAFYNTKDIPLLVFFIFCFTLLFQFIDKRRTAFLILLAVFSALTVTIRISGIIIPCLTIMVLIAHTWCAPLPIKKRIISVIPKLALFLLLFFFFTVLFWPILWSNPVGNFFKAVQEMSHFKWYGSAFFMGETYPGGIGIPPTYTIVWILITTPILYSLLFIIGTVYLIADSKKVWSIFYTDSRRLKILFLAVWFFSPLLLVIILKSVLYDSWRHLFFIYPAFILLAFWGFERLMLTLNNKPGRVPWPAAAVYLILTGTFFSTSYRMILLHPYEQLYFNRLAGERLSDVKTKFDLDYWGLSYRSGLEFLSRNDQSAAIRYYSETTPGTYTFILSDEDQKRLVPVDNQSQAKYLITNYRGTKSYPPYPEVFSVQVGGAKILSIFELR